ncbi:hypothetical protein, partial [Insolitispirillum peregrinum]
TFQMGSLSSPSLQGLSLESTGTGRTEDNAALDDLFRYIKWQAGDTCVRLQNTTAEKKDVKLPSAPVREHIPRHLHFP